MKNNYSKIIDILIQRQYLQPEDKELYTYGLRITVQSLFNIVFVVVSGMVLGMFKESLLMFTTFFVLRKFLGGYHLDKFVYCFASSAAIHCLGLMLIKKQWLMSDSVFLVLIWFCVVMVAMVSPVAHPNKEITEKERRVYKVFSIVLSLLSCIVSTLVILFCEASWCGYSIGSSIIISCILMCVGKIAYIKHKKLKE